jgi:hypothetical protein
LRTHAPPFTPAPAANEGGLDDFPLKANEGDWGTEGADLKDNSNHDPLENAPTAQPPGLQPPPELPPRVTWNPPLTTTWSGRLSKPGSKATESHEQRDSGLVVWLTSVKVDLKEEDFEAYSLKTYLKKKQMEDPIAFAATNDADTLYYNQAMQAPDREEFRLAMEKEVLNNHEECEHWTVFPKQQVPYGLAFCRQFGHSSEKGGSTCKKCTNARPDLRLTAHGGQQVHGVNYWDTHTPGVSWTSIRFFLIISLLSGLYI